MNQRHRHRVERHVWLALVLSVLMHVGLLIAFVLAPERTVEAPAEPPEEFEVVAVTDDEVPTELEEARPEEDEPEVVAVLEEPDAPEEEPPAKEEEPPEEEDAQADPTPPPEEYEKQVVVQNTNDELPTDAEFLSDQANKVEEETRAENTTLEETPDPQEEDANPMADAQQPTEVAEEDKIRADEEVLETGAPDAPPAPAVAEAEVQEPEPELETAAREDEVPPEFADEPLPDEALPEELAAQDQPVVPLAEAAPRPEERAELPDPKSLFEPDMTDYEKVFGADDDQLRERERHDPTERRLLKNWKDKEDAMRAGLENFIFHIKPGNHTSVNAQPAVYASYLARIHRAIHSRYVYGFIEHATLNLPRNHPLNTQSLNTLLEFVIDAKSGKVEQTNIVRSSGETLFDAEVLMIARAVGRHPDPPSQIVSYDGKVYLHWNFWRDSRQCGPFGAKFYIRNQT